MKTYQSSVSELSGTAYEEVAHTARAMYNDIRKKSRRQPYIRSKYFNNEKVFLALFWEHLAQKHRADRLHRLKLYPPAVDLIQNNRFSPDVTVEVSATIRFYRFYGLTKEGKLFIVQIKENSKTGRKDFMSVFKKGARK